MHKKKLRKPDGRNLYLYSTREIPEGIIPTTPLHPEIKATPHMRWHPLRQEWVIYAAHRQNRTFLPPKDYSPLNISTNPEFPTEMPVGDYEVAVFENLFPSMNYSSKEAPEVSVPTMPSNGICEVVVFTQNPEGSLGTLDVERIELVLKVIADRSREIGKDPKIQYVLPFENKGVEMGVTLHHPHGQIYAYPFIPPVQQVMLKAMREYFSSEKKNLLKEMVDQEIKEDRRIICQNENAIAFVPVCARYPYEVWVTLKRSVSYLFELSDQEFFDLAKVLKTLLTKFDGMWERPFPYLLTFIQAPFDEKKHPEFQLHFQIYPPYRTKDKLKFLAGTELGAGIFVNDSLPEQKADELKAVKVEEIE